MKYITIRDGKIHSFTDTSNDDDVLLENQIKIDDETYYLLRAVKGDILQAYMILANIQRQIRIIEEGMNF